MLISVVKEVVRDLQKIQLQKKLKKKTLMKLNLSNRTPYRLTKLGRTK